MSRLDSMLRRLAAQRDGLNWAAEKLAGVPGDALDLGLGNGRTYDHLREILPDRRIWVIDRVLQCHPSCEPPAADLLLGEAEPIGVVFWVTGALGASWLDVLGNIPFMRTVKPRERTAMTTVFSSWRETSAIVAPGLGSLILLLAPFWVFYAVVAGLCLLTAVYVSYLPARI